MAAARVRWLPVAWWSFFALVTGWFLYDSFVYASTRDPQPGATFLNRQLWYLAHVGFALPILLIAPLQFAAGLRGARPQVHRLLGRAFLASSIVAGLLAIYLGATIQYEGSRLPLALFGCVWIGFSVAAWLCARRKDFAAHRRFVIRSFAIGLAFVWVRLLGAVEEQIFFFIRNEEVRDTTGEWMSFILPLLVVEMWLTWWPALSRGVRAQARTG